MRAIAPLYMIRSRQDAKTPYTLCMLVVVGTEYLVDIFFVSPPGVSLSESRCVRFPRLSAAGSVSVYIAGFAPDGCLRSTGR